MGTNFHTAWTTSTIFKTTSMCPALASMDKGITYLKNIIVHCDGNILYNKTKGQLTWDNVLRILFIRGDGQEIQNTINAGNITLADNEFAYVDLNETNNTVLSVSTAAISTGSASNCKAVNRFALAYRNTASNELYSIYLRQKIFTLPIQVEDGGTGLSALGTANQVPGVNAGATALEYKTIQGTTDELEIAHAAGSITLGNPSKAYASVQTTDATVTTLMSKTLAEGKAYIIIANIIGKQADTNRASYVRRACVYRPAAGSATLQGSVQDELTVESDASWDCTIDVSGNDVRVRITGVAATTIDWKGSLEFIEV